MQYQQYLSSFRGMTTYLNRRRVDQSLEIMKLDNCLSGDAKYHAFLVDLHTQLQDEFPASPVVDGFLTGVGIPEDWGRILNVAGYPMTPSGVQPERASQNFLEQLAITGTAEQKSYARNPRLSRDDEKLLDIVLDLCVGYDDEHGAIPNKINANSGAPAGAADPQIAEYAFDLWNSKGQQITDILRTKDWSSLASMWIFPAYMQAYRSQPDMVTRTEAKVNDHSVRFGDYWYTPKIRMVETFDGSYKAASKNLDTKFPVFRVRARTVAMTPKTLSTPLRVLARGQESFLSSSFPFTFKHYTPSDILDKIRRFAFLIAADVDNHDQGISKFVLDGYIKRIRRVNGDALADIADINYRIPLIRTADAVGEKGWDLRVDPYRFYATPELHSSYVNPSGHPLTSILAKLAGCWYALCILYRIVKFTLDHQTVSLVLKGGHPDCGLLNAGDDLIMGVSDQFVEAAKAVNLQTVLPFIKLSSSPAFLGNVLVKEETGEIKAYPNPSSFLFKILVPERSVSHPDRRYFAFGFMERLKIYEGHPAVPRILEILNRLSLKHFGRTFSDVVKEWYQIPDFGQAENYYDSLFITNPDSIFYKLDPKLVSSKILSGFYSSVPYARYKNILSIK